MDTCFCGHTHRGLCFFLQSHILTVFWIMMQAPARYRILFLTTREREEEERFLRGAEVLFIFTADEEER